MKKILLLLIVLQFYSSPSLVAQAMDYYHKGAHWEIKLGEEFHRKAFVGGIGYNIPISQKFLITPQLEVVGSILLSASLKYQFQIQEFKISPQVAAGVLPMMLFNIPVGNFGTDISYPLNKFYTLFLESKMYFFHKKVRSVGSANFRQKNLLDYPPITITIGIRF